MTQLLHIRCKNNKKSLKVPMGSTLSDVFKEINLQMPYGPVSAKVNNKVEGLHYRLYHNKDVEYLDLHTQSGIRTYTRSLFLVLCKAVHDLYSRSEVIIDIPVSNGYYCNLKLGHAITAEDVNRIRTRMQEIVNAHLPIQRFETTTEEAIDMFSKLGDEQRQSCSRVVERFILSITSWMTIRIITMVQCSRTRHNYISSDSNLILMVCYCASLPCKSHPN